jgi:hypothetical protein
LLEEDEGVIRIVLNRDPYRLDSLLGQRDIEKFLALLATQRSHLDLDSRILLTVYPIVEFHRFRIHGAVGDTTRQGKGDNEQRDADSVCQYPQLSHRKISPFELHRNGELEHDRV